MCDCISDGAPRPACPGSIAPSDLPCEAWKHTIGVVFHQSCVASELHAWPWCPLPFALKGRYVGDPNKNVQSPAQPDVLTIQLQFVLCSIVLVRAAISDLSTLEQVRSLHKVRLLELTEVIGCSQNSVASVKAFLSCLRQAGTLTSHGQQQDQLRHQASWRGRT